MLPMLPECSVFRKVNVGSYCLISMHAHLVIVHYSLFVQIIHHNMDSCSNTFFHDIHRPHPTFSANPHPLLHTVSSLLCSSRPVYSLARCSGIRGVQVAQIVWLIELFRVLICVGRSRYKICSSDCIKDFHFQTTESSMRIIISVIDCTWGCRKSFRWMSLWYS